MNIEAFQRYRAEGYNRIPVHAEFLADLDNPLSAFLKVANQPYTFLFESVQGGEKWSRYSIVGLPSHRRIEVHGHRIVEYEGSNVLQELEAQDPLDWIDSYQQQFRLPDVTNLPPVTGGLVGYFGYDTVRFIEPRLGENPHKDPLQTPDILLMVADELLVMDNLSGKLTILVLADATQDDAFEYAQQRLGIITRQLKEPYNPLPEDNRTSKLTDADFTSDMGEQEFKQAVNTIKDYESLAVHVLFRFR